MQDFAGSNRRQYERFETELKILFAVNFDVNTKINFRVKEKDASEFSKKEYRAISRNVSAEGLCFYSDKKLKKGDKLLLDIYIPAATSPVTMEGEVRWCRKAKVEESEKLNYDTGIKLNKVNNETVHPTINRNDEYNLVWSVVLESIFGNFKNLSLKKKQG